VVCMPIGYNPVPALSMVSEPKQEVAKTKTGNVVNVYVYVI